MRHSVSCQVIRDILSHNSIMFAKRLKELRIDKGLTQQQLADALKVDRTTVMKWELGERETNFTMLLKIADYFDTSCDYLIGKTDY